jgi:hypothetical protein
MAVAENPTPTAWGVATTGTLVFTTVAAIGDTISIHVGWNTRTTQPSSVVDDLGNTYTQQALRQHATTAISDAWYVAPVTVGGTPTVTVNYAAGTSFTIHGYRNTGRSGVVDTTGANEGSAVTTTSANPPTLTTGGTAGDDLLSGMRTNNAITAPSYDAGYTGDGTTATIRNLTENLDNVAASTAFTGNFSWTTSSDYVATQIALKAAGGTAYTKTVDGLLRLTGFMRPKHIYLTGDAGNRYGMLLSLYWREVTTKPVTATLPFVGSSPKQTNRNLGSSILSFVGGLSNQTNKTLTAVLSFIGSHATLLIPGFISKALSGTLSFVGSLAKQTNIPLAGTLTFAGVFTKLTQAARTATLSFIGGLTKLTSRLLTAILSFAGAIAIVRNKMLTATLSFIGALTKRDMFKPLAGTLSFTGNIQKFTSTVRTATLSFIGDLFKQTRRNLGSAVLSFIGSLAALKAFTRLLSGTLSFLGSQSKQTGKANNATLTFAGSQSKKLSTNEVSVLSFVGSTANQTRRLLTAILSFAGSISLSKTFVRVFTGVLTFVGTWTKLPNKAANATLSFSGAQTKRTSWVRNAILAFIGTQNSRTSRSVSGILSFSGSFGKQARRAINGLLGLIGSIATQAGVVHQRGTAIGGDLSVGSATMNDQLAGSAGMGDKLSGTSGGSDSL